MFSRAKVAFRRAAVVPPAVKEGKGKVIGALVAGTAVAGGVAVCSADHVPSIDYGWNHHGLLASYDYPAVRRGFQVYREVCASCHALEHTYFRNLVGVTHSEEEVKKIAEAYDVIDGPNAEGEMFERPGKLSDKIPGPYANKEAARAANNGAYPPDLSLITKARGGGVDYIFALLTGYIDPPEGKAILSGLNYNPYFPGGAIAMARQLQDGQLEYEDGTPATTSQMSKDVAVFLAWAAEPEHDYRKKAGVQWIGALLAALALTGFYKRFRWSTLKTAKFHYVA
ncbi:cytochrome c1 [Nannochloropsis oceanica]